VNESNQSQIQSTPGPRRALVTGASTGIGEATVRLLRSHGLENFIRVECFGSPFTWQWVTIRWNPEAAMPDRPDPERGPAFRVYTHHA